MQHIALGTGSVIFSKNPSVAFLHLQLDQTFYKASEDCLYLNVVRPAGYEKKKLPVAFWIHGGTFTNGNYFSTSLRNCELIAACRWGSRSALQPLFPCRAVCQDW